MQAFDPADRRSATPPWHMWGATVQLSAAAVGLTDRNIRSPQVARVNYHRPDTWRFWLGARLTGGNQNLSGITLVASIVIDLIVGVGRSSMDTTEDGNAVGATRIGFAQFNFAVPNTIIPGQQANNNKYVTSVLSVPMDDLVATSTQLIDHVVAQDIQATARMTYPGEATGQATCYLAPNVHLRPDWSHVTQPAAQFQGGEVGGH